MEAFSLRILKALLLVLLTFVPTFEATLIRGTGPAQPAAQPSSTSPNLSSGPTCTATQPHLAPVVTISSPQPYAEIAQTVFKVNFATNTPASTIQYSLDGMPGVPVTGNQFWMNSTGIADFGTHDIVVRVTDSSNETGTSYPLVYYHCPGDILGRGVVDIFDLTFAAILFGSVAGDGRYNATADVTQAGKINIFTLTAIAANFGHRCPQPKPISQEFTIPQIEPARNPAIQQDGSVFLHSGEFQYNWFDPSLPTSPGLHATEWANEQMLLARNPGPQGKDFSSTLMAPNYRSQMSGYDGPLGFNWDQAYDMRLVVEANGNVNLYNGFGRVDTYISLGGGNFQSPSGLYMQLTMNLDGSFRLRDSDGTIDNFPNPVPIHGSQVAQLSTIQDRNGNTLSLGYDALNRLATVTDPLGRVDTYSYGGNGRVSQVRDFEGRTVSIYYDRNDNLVAMTDPAVTGTPNGNDFPNGKTTRYSYDPFHQLLTITNPNEVAYGGPPVLTNTYMNGKVVNQSLGGESASTAARCFGPAGGQITYQYALNQTTVFDRDGNAKQFTFNQLGNPVTETDFTGQTNPSNPSLSTLGPRLRPTDPAYYTTISSYNKEGEITQTIFPQGNSIQYFYDASNPNRNSQGNLLSVTRTPDSGRGGGPNFVSVMNYEYVYNGISKSTDSQGNSIQYIYDYQKGSPSQIQALAQSQGVIITPSQVASFSLGYDVNGDGTFQQHGNIIEERAPNVTAGQPTTQVIRTDFWYNNYGQLLKSIDPQGYADAYVYCPASDPNCDGAATEFPNNQPPLGADTVTGGYLKQVIMDNETLLRTPDFASARVRATTTYTRDDAGNVLSLTDPRGIASTFTVNSLNQIVREVAASDTSHLYPGEPQPLPALSVDTDYAYDYNNQLVQQSIQNKDGNNTIVPSNPFIETYFEYDILGQQTAVVREASGGEPGLGPPQNVTLLERYDANGNLVLSESPVSGLPTNDPAYQPNNVVSTIYDERSLEFKQSRGGIDPLFTSLPGNAGLLGELSAINTPATSTSTLFYDLNGNPVKTVDGMGNATLLTYDGYDRVVSKTDAFGNVENYVYDHNSNLIDDTHLGPPGGNLPGNPTNNVRLSEVKYTYDQLNRLISTMRSLFNTPGTPDTGTITTSYLYDRSSQLTQVTSPGGLTYNYAYDGLGREVRTQGPPVTGPTGALRNEMDYIYDQDGNIVRTVQIDTSPTAPSQTFTTATLYDALNRPIRQTDNLGNTNRLYYDSRGDLVVSTDAKASTLAPDPTGIFPFASTPSGFSMINLDGNKVSHSYDDLSRRVSTTYYLTVGGVGGNPLDTSNPNIPNGLITTHSSYDVNGRLIASTDGNGHTTSFAYDQLNRLNQTKYADGTAQRYSYDKNDNMIQTVDPNQVIIAYTHDSINRLVSVDVNRAAAPFVGGTTHRGYEWDGLTRLTKATDNNNPTDPTSSSTVTLSYDSLSREIQSQQNMPDMGTAGPFTVRTTYNADSQVINVAGDWATTHPYDTQYGYDAAGRLSTVTNNDPANPLNAGYSYIGNRVLGATYSNGVQLSMGYDGVGRPTNITYTGPGSSRQVSLSYAYDRVGNVQTEQFGPTDYFAYNSIYELTGEAKNETGPVVPNNTNMNPNVGLFQNNTQWGLDQTGNWQTQQVTQNGVPTIIMRQANTVNEYVFNSQTGPNRYDNNGNLLSDGSNTYTYNAFNEEVASQSMTSPGSSTSTDWNALGVRTERDGNGSTGRIYTIHFALRDPFSSFIIAETDASLSTQRTFTDGPTGQLWMAKPATPSASFFYATNRMGSVEALLNNSGSASEKYVYGPYGNPTIYNNGVQVTQSPAGNDHLFRGFQYNPDTQTYTVGPSTLDPKNGRFSQRSSIYGATGISELGGNDFIISLGSHSYYQTGRNVDAKIEMNAGTFMHELGHNINLHHGGSTGDCSPAQSCCGGGACIDLFSPPVFSPGKHFYHHYAIFGHYNTCDSTADGCETTLHPIGVCAGSHYTDCVIVSRPAGSTNSGVSAWCRTCQMGTGGSLHLPRIGQEVVVAFESGDPNRPFVIGALYNSGPVGPVIDEKQHTSGPVFYGNWPCAPSQRLCDTCTSGVCEGAPRLDCHCQNVGDTGCAAGGSCCGPTVLPFSLSDCIQINPGPINGPNAANPSSTEFLPSAAGNIDTDPTLDAWTISTSSRNLSPNQVSGEPSSYAFQGNNPNELNDVNF